MIQLVCGKQGAGKTKQLIDMANTLAKTNGVWLMELIRKRYRHLLALQARLDEERATCTPFASAASALRAAPSGPSADAKGVQPPRLPTSASNLSAITHLAKASVSSS